jgi:hypothetical protein
MSYLPDQYHTMPMPSAAPMPLGDKTTAQSGVLPPPPPPSPNTASAGAPTQAKPVGVNLTPEAIAHGAVAPNLSAVQGATTPSPAVAAPAAPSNPGSGGPAAPAGPAFGTDQESKINGFLSRLMSGEGTPFNEGVMGKLRGRLFGAANGQADTAIAQAKDDAIKRGMFRSGLPTDAILQARANAGQNYTKGEADLEGKAAEANSGAQMNAVQALIAQLQNSRQFNLQNRQLAQSAPRPIDYNAQLLQLMGGMDEPSFG